ncbi:hypothetical protein [Streptomyces sp. NBC_00073]|uniref:hypothetical protein n=1 Tax=Streptomyces sp. NBC_00073 TaxID=2975640 RepID=UPI00324C9414
MQIDGIELLALPYAERRRRLEVLKARDSTPPGLAALMTHPPVTWIRSHSAVTG